MNKENLMPLKSIKGYKVTNLPKDFIAGVVIAALSIPVAMGYAEIAGLPSIYGLYASIIAPLAYAIVTGTKNIVFSMDSATAAMTGGMLVAAGIALGTPETIAAMPILTIATAVFLILFSITKASRAMSLIPIPVIHGFICGVSISVIIGQIPMLLGITPDMSGNVIQDIIQICLTIPQTNIAAAGISALSLVAIALMKKFAPKLPNALIVLVITTIIACVLAANGTLVDTIPEVESGLPTIAAIDFGSVDMLKIVGCAFVIAVIVSLESLMCIESFALKTGEIIDGDKELSSFGIANLVAGIFGCPPCSASVSRTAAGMSAGSISQLAAIFSALVVAAVCLFCGPVISMLPKAALSAIVVVALIDVVDFAKLKSYIKETPVAFAVFFVSALIVVVFGAIPGIICGVIMSVALKIYRKHLMKKDFDVLGPVPYSNEGIPKKDEIETGYNTAFYKIAGDLSFLNASKVINEIENCVNKDENTQAIVIKISKLDRIDTTACDKLIQELSSLISRGIHVKLVRKMKITSDHYTRSQLRKLMGEINTYPNTRIALWSLKNEYDKGLKPRTPKDWIEEANDGEEIEVEQGNVITGDRAIMAIAYQVGEAKATEDNAIELFCDIKGKLSFMQSETEWGFMADYAKDKDSEHPFEKLRIYSTDQDKILAEYRNGEWTTYDEEERENIEYSVTAISTYIENYTKASKADKNQHDERNTTD